ncbi:hypothetical protein GALL_71510 [mine drainage metagenome]|uniref:Uncharacterized protein n=1 Tax=mine drainage metagenome TaxID=410659 RepID=A0A1J5TB21_9ZZZZ
MAKKRFVVREGFHFRLVQEDGREKIYSEGDIVELEQAEGTATHQLEYADEKDRAAAFKAEIDAHAAKQQATAIGQAQALAQALSTLQMAIAPASAAPQA